MKQRKDALVAENNRAARLMWFRDDLRLADNPALTLAAQQAEASAGPLVCVYVLDEPQDYAWRLGGAARWWLHYALAALQADLQARGGQLWLFEGAAEQLIPQIAQALGVGQAHWNRCYDAHRIDRDTKIKKDLIEKGVTAQSHAASLLFEPWEIKNKSDGVFKVFTPFFKALFAKLEERGGPVVLPQPPKFHFAEDVSVAKQLEAAGLQPKRLEDLALTPTKPDWAAGLRQAWQPGEAGAWQRLQDFLSDGMQGYKELRNRPDLPHVSRLSPYLRWGHISPGQVWQAVRTQAGEQPFSKDQYHFLSELGWREFSYYLLYHWPDLPTQNWRSTFDAYPWRDDPDQLAAWQQGNTGYPLVDAGMRQLWSEGWVHNRVRMVVASFLIKHLQLDWRAGQAWFWDTLVDADLASNSASWQWVAGSGADAAPYFRIFNPTGQGEKLDPQGAYVHLWLPNLRHIPAPDCLQPGAGGYAEPLVDHRFARQRALDGYEHVKLAV